ncbi:toxin C-terminal domain-containing protein [Thauera sp. SDU_THAU2]|uniref:toxin C-terminal domain-containing protein n=1 Tax=Thauera sp. SDU_THAU2 TaxID=3136633 RepID=UPI00311F886A
MVCQLPELLPADLADEQDHGQQHGGDDDRLQRGQQVRSADGGGRLRYTGQQLLDGLNLYYYKARFYSPAIGRFLQTDPIGTADDLNLYAYVGNNPINFNDPTGLAAKELELFAGKVGGSIDRWWDSSVAGFQSATLEDSVDKILQGWPGGGATAKGAGALFSVLATKNAARLMPGPICKTTKEATAAAKALGYKKISETVHGEAVYKKGNSYITRDATGHNGGAWKMAESVDKLKSKTGRDGTFDVNLNRIGD